MPLNSRLRRQAGDTIIEVMIVLSVLGLAISISYATANRSLLNARQAQENSYATELAQSQVERIRSLVSATGANSPFQAGNFCIDTSNTRRATSSAACKPGTSFQYNIVDTYSSSSDLFTVKISWPDVNGRDTDTANLVYRVHQP